MIAYLFKRLLAMIPTLLGISLITFLIVLLSPGDPVATQMGQGGGKDVSGGGGSSQDPNRQADAKKAKMKLLGMLEEHRIVREWDGVAAVASRDWESGDKYVTVDEMLPAGELGDFESWVQAIDLSPDDTRIYAGTKEGRIVALDAVTGEVVTEFAHVGTRVTSLAVSPDGTRLVSGDGEGGIRVFDTANGTELVVREPIGRQVGDVAFMPDGGRFVTACDDGALRVHETATGAVVKQLSGHNNYVRAVAVAADGSRIWSGGYDRELREWDTSTWATTRVIGRHDQTINDLALSRDGRLLASASDDAFIRVFDLSEEEPAGLLLKGHYAAASAVAFHPDGRTLFSGGIDETIRTWDVVLEKQTAQVPVTTGKVHEIRVDVDGGRVFSAADSWRKTPPWKQYWNWLSKIAVGDFGRSFTDNKPVLDKMWERLPVTIGLNLGAFVLMYLISIPLGVKAAVGRGGWFDTVTSVIVFMLWSLPSFFLATILIIYFSSERNLNWFPSVGLQSTTHRDMSYLQWLGDYAMHLVLPMIVLTYGGFASLSRYARTSLLETIQQDFIRTARAKGLSERVVIYKHALRNSLIAIITLVGTLLPAMIGGSVIIEFIFSIRGMGLLAFEAILQRDYPVIMAVTTFGALLTLVGVLVSDLLYSVADPRITHR